MVILAGLGNPGPGYAGHRHNAGFMLLDRIAERHGFSQFKARNRSATAEGRLGSGKVILVKPLDFMNKSGLPIRELLDFYKLDTEALTVAHDEIDLAPGKVRIKYGGGHGGHNGLRDIGRHLGDGYRRLRIGIGRHPNASSNDKMVDSHVLSDFTVRERKQWLDPLLDCMADEIGLLYNDDDNGFMTKVARFCPPPAEQDEERG